MGLKEGPLSGLLWVLFRVFFLLLGVSRVTLASYYPLDIDHTNGGRRTGGPREAITLALFFSGGASQ